LDGILQRCRADGWAREDGEITAEYASVGAAAVDRNGYPSAAVGLTFLGSAATAEHWETLGKLAHATAAALTARLRPESR
jgi:DNA-binding IclR family transcriptional regulator